MRSVIYSTADDNNYFAIPNSCNVIWVSGCGGGGGGANANSTTGAVGGGPAPCFWRVPLSVQAGGVIGVHVGVAGLAGQSIGVGGYNRTSGVCGAALRSPLISASYLPLFCMGFGEQGPGACPGMYSVTTDGGTGTRMTVATNTTGDWVYAAATFPMFLMPPIIKGDKAQAPPLNPYDFGLNGLRTFMDLGLGTEAASDPTYSTGGGGGGGAFGRGGAGGVYSGAAGNGGTATGYGAGGGGGSGGPNPYGQGGGGSAGIVIIEY